jgi:hypothetical protein
MKRLTARERERNATAPRIQGCWLMSVVDDRSGAKKPGKAVVVLAGLVFLLVGPADACRYDPNTIDRRPLAARLAEALVAFIGTVSGVRPDGMVEFHVEHVLHGVTDGERFFVKVENSSCDRRFLPGERWLYGGTTLFHPGVLLVGGRSHAGPALVRAEDSKLAFAAQWQACKSDSECSVLPYGCTATAVNKGFLPVATERAWKIGGDPRALDCATVQASFEKALCEQGKCGFWRLQRYP